ncbi:probable nucleolar protein 5-1 [Cornus florida]|uniref:probable nucleolar protein 5-1 n=1 Tax=Cornus florida TaxID=4283 RepID=UPI002899B881|nr:probable nucleolar protein 5-1 [Cornus florida]
MNILARQKDNVEENFEAALCKHADADDVWYDSLLDILYELEMISTSNAESNNGEDMMVDGILGKTILPEEVETELIEAAIISMGTEVSELDLINMKDLCDQGEPLPNLTALVGELVGVRLTAHGDSLLNLAKQPGSTVQIFGAEKALFRALKTKQHQNIKENFHALAAKTALAILYDALGNGEENIMGLENRAKAKGKPKIELYDKDRKKGAGALITAAKEIWKCITAFLTTSI